MSYFKQDTDRVLENRAIAAEQRAEINEQGDKIRATARNAFDVDRLQELMTRTEHKHVWAQKPSGRSWWS